MIIYARLYIKGSATRAAAWRVEQFETRKEEWTAHDLALSGWEIIDVWTALHTIVTGPLTTQSPNLDMPLPYVLPPELRVI